MNILKVNKDFLKDNGQQISVSIIDSGFINIPSYATLYGNNSFLTTNHGSRILSIFTALDELYPLKNLKLNLVCYNPEKKYEGLIKSLNLLPHSDILSISIAWKQDNNQLYHLLMNKADKICVPYSVDTTTPYPSVYKGTITCSNIPNDFANYYICPNSKWQGNSYAVPAIARLLCYGNNLVNDDKGIKVNKLFSKCDDGSTKINALLVTESNINKCPYCSYKLVNKYHETYLQKITTCPRCGMPLL